MERIRLPSTTCVSSLRGKLHQLSSDPTNTLSAPCSPPALSPPPRPRSDIAPAWTASDNTSIVATDSILNTCRYFAKVSPHVLQPETFALELGLHFVNTYAHIHKAHVDITKLKWSRIAVKGAPHKHSFVRDGEDKRHVAVVVDATRGKAQLSATLKAGVSDLLVLKSTGSSFENFVRDKFTTLPDVNDRIFSTSVECSYEVPIPASALSAAALPKIGINFEAIYASMMETTLEIFSTHNSASVQATLYLM